MSVTLLYYEGKRLSDYMVRTQVPQVGWLFLQPNDYGGSRTGSCLARLLREDGLELVRLEHAWLVESLGPKGALIEGVEYRKKGRKHSISDRQAWWVQAPPRLRAYIDHAARVRAAEERSSEERRRLQAELDRESPAAK